MIEASILLVELILFGLVLFAVRRPLTAQPARDLGLFSYREKIDTSSETGSSPAKGSRRA